MSTSRRVARGSFEQPVLKVSFRPFAFSGIEQGHSFFHVANGGHRHIGRDLVASQITLDVLQFLGHGTSKQLCHHGRDILGGEVTIEFIDDNLAQQLCRLVLATAFELVNDVLHRTARRETFEDLALSLIDEVLGNEAILCQTRRVQREA